jgi:ribosomal protein S18 acetylase RimI-like enzyme
LRISHNRDIVRGNEEMNMQNIRAVLPQDIPYLYSVALKTAFAGLDGTPYFNDPWCVGHYYAAPYFFYEPELCFMALDENGSPSGYIVGTSDTASYTSWLQKTWLPPLQEYYNHQQVFKSEAEESIIKTLLKGPGQGMWQNLGYPAHLHIDLLPQLQGKGLGRSLMETFIKAVQEKGVPGIHLGVDGKNTRAYGFYERMGFTILEQQSWGSVFGKQLI